jgi:hypothetical protein
MKKIYLLILTFILNFSVSPAVNAQNRDSIVVPKADEIVKITFEPLQKGETAIVTRKSLLAMLPRLIPAIDRTYFTDTSTQDGTITLKNGKILNWSSAYRDSLVLSDGKNAGLFFVFVENLEKELTLPKAEDVVKVSFSSKSKKGFTRKSLLKTLPDLVPNKNAFIQGKLIRRGTLTLKDETVLRWATNGKGCLILHHGNEKSVFCLDLQGELTIPKAEDINAFGVEPSDGKWFTPQTLWEALPKFVAGGSYETKKIWQYGFMELKTGVLINWRADSPNTLMLFTRGGATYFHIPTELQK